MEKHDFEPFFSKVTKDSIPTYYMVPKFEFLIGPQGIIFDLKPSLS